MYTIFKLKPKARGERAGEHRIPTNQEYEAHREKHHSQSEAYQLALEGDRRESLKPRFVLVKATKSDRPGGMYRERYGNSTYSDEQAQMRVDDLNRAAFTKRDSQHFFQMMRLSDFEIYGANG